VFAGAVCKEKTEKKYDYGLNLFEREFTLRTQRFKEHKEKKEVFVNYLTVVSILYDRYRKYLY